MSSSAWGEKRGDRGPRRLASIIRAGIIVGAGVGVFGATLRGVSRLDVTAAAGKPASGSEPTGTHPDLQGWKLVWQDDFERQELGSAWFILHGQAEIRAGRLLLRGAGATALVDRPFASDVLVELVAQADPEKPPCDLSVALGASTFWGYEYLLAFGGNNNQLNQILGGAATRIDRQPPMLIEPGRTYRLRGVKDGRRLSYHVDGTRILESADDDPVGGPGFDRVGLVTWNGMYVDEVKVYEREEPAPDGPVILGKLPDTGLRWEDRKLSWSLPWPPPGSIQAGIQAYNARRPADAFEAFARHTPPILPSVAGMAWAEGDLAWDAGPGDAERVASLATELARSSPRDGAARDFAFAAQQFRRIDIRSRDRRAVTRLVMAGQDHNPFYWKAELFRARYHHASAVEGADSRRVREAAQIFERLRDAWPDVPALRELAGEKLPWGMDRIRPESSGPAWARHLEECFARQHAILEWWFRHRQAPDGSLGGGWGDDVEILRGWAPVACVSTAGETAMAGIERMAEGVWQDVLVDGYSGEVGDVEHSAEPSADALPPMILLRYGDPRFVEWNLRSARTIRERFLAINDRGRLQFRSAEFGAEGVNSHPRAGGDTGYHARAMRHFVWLAWYGVPEARDVFLAWCETWREATLSALGGKPAGFVPASIFFPSGGIEPPDGRSWNDPAAHYYGFPGIVKKIHESLLTACLLGGGPACLEPVDIMLRMAETGPLPGGDPRDPLTHLVHQADRDILAVHRRITGERSHDAWLKARGSAVQRFQVDGDLAALERSLEKLVVSLRHGWATRTSEVLQTDRAGLPGDLDVLCAYTGAVRDFSDTGGPTQAVTWDSRSLQFAALVEDATERRLRVRIHAFSAETFRVGLRPWRLTPGTYSLGVGELLEAEAGGPARVAWRPARNVTHVHRGAPIWIELPPERTFVADLVRTAEVSRGPALPDLAIARRDVRREGRLVRATIHNIGATGAGTFAMAVEARAPGGNGAGSWTEEARVRIDGIRAIQGLRPAVIEATLELPTWAADGAAPPRSAVERRVILDPEGAVDEICEANNTAALE